MWLLTGMPNLVKVPTVVFQISSIHNNSYKIYIILCGGKIIVGPKVAPDLCIM